MVAVEGEAVTGGRRHMDLDDESLVIAQPQASERLLLLFHGMGSSARALAPLGETLARAFPRTAVVSVEAPHPSQSGRGKEWFSVAGISDANRLQRVAQVMPLFLQSIAHWQGVTGLDAARTVLVGFSQGAIMSLESTQADSPPLAHTLVALAGRLAAPARRAPAGVRMHLIHGEDDAVVPARCSIEAERELRALGGEATLDLLPGLGHAIDSRMVQRVLERVGRD